MRRTGVLLGVLMTCLLAACASESADPKVTTVTTIQPTAPETSEPDTGAPETSEPESNTPETSEPDAVTPEGYERVQATVTAADGTACDLCLWLAESADQRSQGLMFVTDLGPADGMAFVYPAPHSGNFWMKNTLLPLSIAFFDPAGAYLAAFDMEPCTAEPCDLYPTPADFLVAIETRQGDLSELGIGPGSILELTDLPCG